MDIDKNEKRTNGLNSRILCGYFQPWPLYWGCKHLLEGAYTSGTVHSETSAK